MEAGIYDENDDADSAANNEQLDCEYISDESSFDFDEVIWNDLLGPSANCDETQDSEQQEWELSGEPPPTAHRAFSIIVRQPTDEEGTTRTTTTVAATKRPRKTIDRAEIKRLQSLDARQHLTVLKDSLWTAWALNVACSSKSIQEWLKHRFQRLPLVSRASIKFSNLELDAPVSAQTLNRLLVWFRQHQFKILETADVVMRFVENKQRGVDASFPVGVESLSQDPNAPASNDVNVISIVVEEEKDVMSASGAKSKNAINSEVVCLDNMEQGQEGVEQVQVQRQESKDEVQLITDSPPPLMEESPSKRLKLNQPPSKSSLSSSVRSRTNDNNAAASWIHHQVGNMQRLVKDKCGSEKDMAMLFVAIARLLQIPCRLVCGLYPGSKTDTVSYQSNCLRVRKSFLIKNKQAIETFVFRARTAPKEKSQPLKRRNYVDSSSSSDEDEFTAPPLDSTTNSSSINSKPDIGCRYWAELFVETSAQKGKWTAIDCVSLLAGEDAQIYRSLPFGYVVAMENNVCVDATCRYISRWKEKPTHPRSIEHFSQLSHHAEKAALTMCRLNGSSIKNWWVKILKQLPSLFCRRVSCQRPFDHSTTQMERLVKERKELSQQFRRLCDQFPTSLHGFKNHPTLCISKFLSKFEIPREDTTPVKLFKQFEVYRRCDIERLRGSMGWLKQGYSVQKDATPVKTLSLDNTSVVALYRKSQCDVFSPPVCHHGTVPKNEFGNCYLFQPQMLPLGATHFGQEYEGIQKVAVELQIDYAKCLVGWNSNAAKSIPKFDGIAVCTESAVKLKEAWEVKNAEKQRLNAIAKRKKVLSNWYRLVKVALVHIRLQNTYNHEQANSQEHVVIDLCEQDSAEEEKGDELTVIEID